MTETATTKSRKADLSPAADPDDYAFFVHGVAHGEDEITFGLHGAKYWPADEVANAAATLSGQTVWAAHGDEDRRPVGEVVRAAYEKGVGVVYEAGLEDGDIAKELMTGDREVSIEAGNPSSISENEVGAVVFHDYEYTGLATPKEGASDANYTAPGSADGNPAIAALEAGDIKEFLDDEAALNEYKSVGGVRYRGTRGGKLDESEIASDGYTDNYLFDGDTKTSSSYPVVDADGYVRRGNVAAAYSVGPRGGVEREELYDKLRPLNEAFGTPPIDPSKLETDSGDLATPEVAHLREVDGETVVLASEGLAMDPDESVSPGDGQGEGSGIVGQPNDHDPTMDNDPNTEAFLSRLETKEDRIDDLEAELEDTKDELEETKADLEDTEADLEDTKADLEDSREDVTVVKETYAAALSGASPFDEEELVEKFDVAELKEKVEAAEEAALANADPDVQTGGDGGDDNDPEDDETAELEMSEDEAEARVAALRGMGMNEKAADLADKLEAQ